MNEHLVPVETKPNFWRLPAVAFLAGCAGVLIAREIAAELADIRERKLAEKTNREINDYFDSFKNGGFDRGWQEYDPSQNQAVAVRGLGTVRRRQSL